MSVQTQIDRIITNISNAYNSVRDKGGTIPTTQDTENLASAITSIPSGTDTSDANATANDILLNKTAYVKGSKITGNIQSKSSTNLTVSGATITAPAGYYPSNASKSVSTMTLPTSTSTSHTGTSKYTIGRSTSTRYLNIPAGYNSSAGYYTINAVPDGTQGTPTATKGSVSNHSISVTPRCTDTTGYISGTTKTGTAVTVTASELVSGSETKTENGTYDVTNLAQVVVNVSGGGGEIYDGTVEDYVAYDYTQSGSEVTLNNAPYEQSGNEVIIL